MPPGSPHAVQLVCFLNVLLFVIFQEFKINTPQSKFLGEYPAEALS